MTAFIVRLNRFEISFSHSRLVIYYDPILSIYELLGSLSISIPRGYVLDPREILLLDERIRKMPGAKLGIEGDRVMRRRGPIPHTYCTLANMVVPRLYQLRVA